MDIKFYQENNLWKFTDTNGVEQGVPLGMSKWSFNQSRVSIRVINAPDWLFYDKEVTTILKSETADDYYESITEFLLLNEAFFSQRGSITNSDGIPIDVQNPFPIDGDSVYDKDIDWVNSDFTGWDGNEQDLFKSPFSASIVNNTNENPKRIVLSFNRTLSAAQLGLGENNGGDFSNVKISALGSGGVVRGVYDGSLLPIKRNSFNIKAPQELFNSFLIEFYTPDPVSLSNITIQKVRLMAAQLQAYNPDSGLVESITATNGYINALTRDKEYEDYVNKWGANEDVDTGTIPETSWDGSNLYTYTDENNPVTYAFSSTSTADVGSIIEVELITLDPATGDYIEEIVEGVLNGQNKVLFTPASGNLVLGSNRGYPILDTPELLGDVYIYESQAVLSAGIPTDETLVRSIILTYAKQTRQAVYILPDINKHGKRIQGGHVIKWSSGIYKSRDIAAEIFFMVKEPGGAFRARDLGLVTNAKDAGEVYGKEAPLKIPTKSRVEVRCVNISANDGAIISKFQIQKVLEDEQF